MAAARRELEHERELLAQEERAACEEVGELRTLMTRHQVFSRVSQGSFANSSLAFV